MGELSDKYPSAARIELRQAVLLPSLVCVGSSAGAACLTVAGTRSPVFLQVAVEPGGAGSSGL